MIYNASHRVATTYTDSLQVDNISYSVYIEYDYFNPVYLTQGSDKSQYPKFTALYKIQNQYNCFVISHALGWQ